MGCEIILDDETARKLALIEYEYKNKLSRYKRIEERLDKDYVKAHQSEINMYGHIVEIWDSI